MIPKHQPRHKRIEKSVLTYGEPHRIRDRKYLDSFKGRACESCGRVDGTVIAAHISWDSHVSHSQKADDRRTVALCFACHQQQESQPGPEWWMRMVFFRELEQRYLQWAGRNAEVVG